MSEAHLRVRASRYYSRYGILAPFEDCFCGASPADIMPRTR
jgi:hypothetical protein